MSEFLALQTNDNRLIDAWCRAKSQVESAQITQPAGGFPASVLESLRRIDQRFGMESALRFIRDGADLFAEIPGVELSTFDTARSRDHIEVTRLTNPSMFAILLFRTNMESRSTLRPHYPKEMQTVPKAGLLSVFDEDGSPVVTDREVNILEYAAFSKVEQRDFDQILSKLDKSAPEVQQGLNRALSAFITGIGLDKPLPTGGNVLAAARTLMSLLNAGADPHSLKDYQEGDQERQPQFRMVRLLIGILLNVKAYPGQTANPGKGEIASIESALERILVPDPDTGTLPFDIDYRDPKTHRTLLHYAAECAGPTTIWALLHAGADVDAELDGRRFRPDAPSSVTPMTIAQIVGENTNAAVLQSWKAKRAISHALDNALRSRTPTAS